MSGLQTARSGIETARTGGSSRDRASNARHKLDLPQIHDEIANPTKRADVGFERGMRQDSTLPEVDNRLVPRGFRIKAMGRNRLVLLFEREGVTT